MENKWPTQAQAMSFYGDPRKPGWLSVNTVYIDCPWDLLVGKTPVKKIMIHKKCADSLRRVLMAVWLDCGKDQKKINSFGYNIYDGSYNLRSMRGSANMSMHSYACAIDWNAAKNPFHAKKFLFKASDPLIARFKEESWVWGGEWSNPDGMHVQACRVR